jgi:hypothetical protein
MNNISPTIQVLVRDLHVHLNEFHSKHHFSIFRMASNVQIDENHEIIFFTMTIPSHIHHIFEKEVNKHIKSNLFNQHACKAICEIL